MLLLFFVVVVVVFFWGGGGGGGGKRTTEVRFEGIQRVSGKQLRGAENKPVYCCCFGKEEVLRLGLKESRESFCRRGRKVIPCRRAENRKGAGTNCGKSDRRNLQA